MNIKDIKESLFDIENCVEILECMFKAPEQKDHALEILRRHLDELIESINA